jgi:hypothetical protein
MTLVVPSTEQTFFSVNVLFSPGSGADWTTFGSIVRFKTWQNLTTDSMGESSDLLNRDPIKDELMSAKCSDFAVSMICSGTKPELNAVTVPFELNETWPTEFAMGSPLNI